MFAFLAEHRRELFPDEFTADLFPSRTGRPWLPADLVGPVLVLKELHDLSDTQTADALKDDLRWKIACGRSLLETSFDPSVLVYSRKRIAKSARPDQVFDAVAEVSAETGILRGRRGDHPQLQDIHRQRRPGPVPDRDDPERTVATPAAPGNTAPSAATPPRR